MTGISKQTSEWMGEGISWVRTDCLQPGLAQDLLHAACYTILNKLPTLTSLEVFHEDF